jgi:hypothetical protein
MQPVARQARFALSSFGVFHAGQLLSGRLIVPMWQPMKIVCLEESSIAFD